jgi:ATP-dependent Clp endopeptidase proteolytic subunit ClpP
MATRRYKTDDIDKFFEYDISLPTRTIYMGSVHVDMEEGESGTDASMAERVIKNLHVLETITTQAEQGEKPITIIMNNIGGDEYHGLAIFDAIKLCRNHIDIKVFGHAMSMGSIILQAADRRVMSPNSRMMIHYGTWGYEGDAITSEKWSEEGKRFNTWMEDLYLSKLREKDPKFRRDRLKRMLTNDTFFNAEEAVKIGLADEILE